MAETEAELALSFEDVKAEARKALEALEKVVVTLEEAAEYLPQVLAVLKVIAAAVA